MKNTILRHFNINNKTTATHAVYQYRMHPTEEQLCTDDENISQTIIKHIRACPTCSRIHNNWNDNKRNMDKTTYTITEINIGDILIIPTKNISDTDRSNDKNEYFNPPEICILDINDNDVSVAQCFPIELKPIANKGDILTNDGYYVESWNQYILPYSALFIDKDYTYDLYIKKAVSKKLLKNITGYSNGYHTNNHYSDKFRECELRIAQIWRNIIQKK